jgi:DNA damage-inducible protein 1
MRITFNISGLEDEAPEVDLLSLEFPSDATVGLLKESVQAEARIPTTSQHIYHNGRLLSDDSKTMEQLQVNDGDMLAVHIRDLVRSTIENPAPQPTRRQATGPPQTSRSRTEQDPEVVRLQLLGNPQALQAALRLKPEIAAVINDPSRFADVYRQMLDQEREEQMMRRREIAALNNDPFDVAAQMRIAEIIREEAVQENLQNAIEHNPEGKLANSSAYNEG